MNRRDAVVALLALGAAPMASFAQQKGKVWHLGFLGEGRRPDSTESGVGAFLQGMRELGYVEGKDLEIEWRFADGNLGRLAGLAEELVRLKVDVIVGAGTQAVGAAQKATGTIPIVMGTVGDPVSSGFVKSLARPEGNITGLSEVAVDISPKLLEMLLGIVPKLSRVAVLINPSNSSHAARLKNIESAARQVNVEVLPMEMRTPQDIDGAFSLMARKRVEAVIVATDTLFVDQRRRLAELAMKHRLPLVAGNQRFVEAGCLVGYGPNLIDNLRRAAAYVDKIFKGAKPGDLPVEQPTKFDLAINLKTAKTLGVTIPQSVLVRADRVIE